MRKAWVVPLAVILLCAGLCDARAAGDGANACGLKGLTVSDRNICLTCRYAGELVKISGMVDPGCDVVVKLTAPRVPAVFSRIGKAGPFWLSRERIYFDNVPQMYKEKCSRPLEEILSPAEQVHYHLGFRGLRASVKLRTHVNHPDLYLNELIAVRQAARLYNLGELGVRHQGSRFFTSFFWPPRAPSGHYEIEALAVKNRRVVAVESTSIEIRKVGIEAFIANLARTNGVLYGLFAVLLALAVGYSMSLLFALFRRRPAPKRKPTDKVSTNKDLAA